MAIMRPLMNHGQLKDWILRQLGMPVFKVQLTCDHLDDVLDEAQHWFCAKKGVKRRAIVVINSSQQEYDLPDEVDTVLDVVFPVPALDLSLIFSPFVMIDEKVPYDVFAAGASAGLYSTFVQTIQYVNMAKRILGAESDWRQEGRKLLLFPNPKNAGAILIEYKSNTFTLEQLNERDHDLVRRYALSRAKVLLGLIRSTYNSYPSAQGQVILNGPMLLDQGTKELEQLNEEIMLSGYPAGFLVG